MRLLELAPSIILRLVHETPLDVLLFHLHALFVALTDVQRLRAGNIAVRIPNNDSHRRPRRVIDDPRSRRSARDDGGVGILGEAGRTGRFVRAKDGKVVWRGGLSPGEGCDAALSESLLLISQHPARYQERASMRHAL